MFILCLGISSLFCSDNDVVFWMTIFVGFNTKILMCIVSIDYVMKYTNTFFLNFSLLQGIYRDENSIKTIGVMLSRFVFLNHISNQSQYL